MKQQLFKKNYYFIWFDTDVYKLPRKATRIAKDGNRSDTVVDVHRNGVGNRTFTALGAKFFDKTIAEMRVSNEFA